jgi:hypothetical protein
MKHQVFSAVEWLYPDSEIMEGGKQSIELAGASGGRTACQILFKGIEAGAPVKWRFRPDMYGVPAPEVYQMIDVLAEMNTAPDGFTLPEGEPARDYSTRQAPFRVYDALKPVARETEARADTEAFYVCWRVPSDAPAGRYTGKLVFEIGSESAEIPVAGQIYGARVPYRGKLHVTNWFNIDNIATRHGLELWSDEHWRMIERYGRMMRRGRQNHFWVPMTLVKIGKGEGGAYTFDFSRTERLIKTFFRMGFTTLEGGHVAGRAHFWDETFILRTDREIAATSPEGYAFLAQYLPAWRAFLEENGWLDRAIQYIADEPTPRCAPDYRTLAAIMRKFLPGVRLLDAVETPYLGGSVDIWVPKNSFYQENRDAFEQHRAFGDELWFYTCCIPGGRFMNRLLDMPLIRTRLLHWGNYLYNLTGYLHWGLNFGPEDAFNGDCTPTGSGDDPKHLPPGDTHIIYPGDDGPWSSVRFEAMAAGIEDYELLRALSERDKVKANAVVREIVRSFDDFDEDPAAFDAAHRALLKAASQR